MSPALLYCIHWLSGCIGLLYTVVVGLADLSQPSSTYLWCAVLLQAPSDAGADPPLPAVALAGATGGVALSVVLAPTELVKVSHDCF